MDAEVESGDTAYLLVEIYTCHEYLYTQSLATTLW